VIAVADEPSTTTVTTPQGHLVMTQQQPRIPHVEPPWWRLPADPEYVRVARDYAAVTLSRKDVEDIADDVRLVVSEIVTNAMRAAQRYARVRGAEWAAYERPVSVRVICRPHWAHIIVTDPDPAKPEPEPADCLADSGRGLSIVESVAALMWFVTGDHGKACHVVVTRSGVELTPDEAEMLTKRVIL
jgi:anti-sigma regulatory factor (Ser/Thr protein kinase)